MQNLDYEKGSLRKAFHSLMNKEGLSPLYRGYPGLLASLFL
jgi:hypothetical protein